MQQKEKLAEFPHFQGFDQSIIEKSSPPNRALLRRRHSTKLIERSDFIDSTFQTPIQISPTKQSEQSLDAPDSSDPLDPIHPKRKLQRRKSDSSIVAEYYKNFDDMPADLPRSSRLRRNQPDKINTSGLNKDNNNQAPMSCPSKNVVANTVFDDILRIKETFDDNRPTSLKRPSKTRRQLYVDEFDDTPKISADKRGNSDDENSRDGIRAWETSPRKSDLHRSLRNQKDIDAF